ncbi:extracellular catalytic domain type 1 short-chain-length polyhydroxyalkanoate depolymerase [Niallia sp. Krafla_26]|uniref:extracellular catalytic domain type 1 short-chain-length polyhydroxyalkanoate depolymerase n=1 Tax=Niallia sp. Krafla_26 TaxID=3064703 RepID=UPI003D1721F3
MGTFKEYLHEGFIYKLYVPNVSSKETPLPLVVMLHGCEQDSDQFSEETGMNELAEKEQFIVLYPTMNRLFNPLFDEPHKSNPAGCWNWFLEENQRRGMGLPKIIASMITAVEQLLKNRYQISVDRRKIYAAGFSAGGAMAGILGVTYPDLFSGIASFAGLPYDAAKTNLWKDPWNREAELAMKNGVKDPYESGELAFRQIKKALSTKQERKKVPIIIFHGMNDTTVNPVNSKQLVIQWAQMHHLLAKGYGRVNVIPSKVELDVSRNGKNYTYHVYEDSRGELLIEFWQIHEMGHTWSGGKKGLFCDPTGPDASSIIWNFFKKI